MTVSTLPASTLVARKYSGLAYHQQHTTPWSVWIRGEIVYFATTRLTAEDVFRREWQQEVAARN